MSFLVEGPVLLIAGAGLARMLGISGWDRLTLLALPFGFFLKLTATALSWVLGTHWLTLPILGALALIFGGAALFRSQVGDMIKAVYSLVLLCGLSTALANLERLPVIAHADSLDILATAEFFAEERQLPASTKRGFTLPLLMAPALGQPLVEFVPYTALSLIYGLWVLGRQLQQHGLVGPWDRWFALLLVGSTPIVLFGTSFINNHHILALGLLTMVVTLLDYRPSEKIFARAGSIAIPALFASFARIEGVAYVVALILIFRALEIVALNHRLYQFVLLVAPIPTLAWAAIAQRSELPLGAGVFVSAYFAFGFLVTVISPLALLALARLMPLALIFTFLGVTLLKLLSGSPPMSLIQQVAGQIVNIFMLQGGWGLTGMAILASIVILIEEGRVSAKLRLCRNAVLGLILLVLTLKLIESNNFGRVGFLDSVNRSWIHLVSLWYALSAWALNVVRAGGKGKREDPSRA